MADRRKSDHRPIQTSAVIVLGAQKAPAVPPPSPPTPCLSPDDTPICEPASPFSLGDCDLDPSEDATTARRLLSGLHVLTTEAAALASLTKLYQEDAYAREGFDNAVELITRRSAANGKVVVIGVGKSGHIGKKMVATLQSLAIRSVFLHPTEALHGDLGIIGPDDTLLFITYSGKTPELMMLLPHLDDALPAIIVTSHTRPETCELWRHRPGTILLPTPVPEAEKTSFGVPAPSTSTTTALALCDALAITVANELHQDLPIKFARNHPGGAIGQASRQPQTVKQACVPWNDLVRKPELNRESLAVDVLRAGFESQSGFVKLGDGVAAPTRIRQLSNADMSLRLQDIPDLITSHHDMISIPSDMSIQRARDVVLAMRAQGGRAALHGPGAVIAVTEGGATIGILEACVVIDCQAIV
ncbi:hypothetical protein HIM_02252 [Hirsutella minnesotensis 3608]|nr:hypothetical protein HIM_02252 [Hirsutella minnesotensis 3608]